MDVPGNIYIWIMLDQKRKYIRFIYHPDRNFEGSPNLMMKHLYLDQSRPKKDIHKIYISF